MARTERSLRVTNPPHPAIDWSTLRQGPRAVEVQATCPVCRRQRWIAAATTRLRIRRGVFIGRCHDCTAPPTRDVDIPAHPAVARTLVRAKNGRLRALVSCPACGGVRPMGLGPLRQRIREGTFTGLCARDNAAAARAAGRERTR